MMIFMIVCLSLGSENIKECKSKVIIISIFALSHLLIFVNLVYHCKTYSVCSEGVFVKWLNIFKFRYYWSEINFIETGIVRIRGIIPIENDAIIFSKIPIKHNKGFLDEYSYIDSDWIFNHPKKVFEIRLNDFKEGQLEEFWSYVPERLKK